MFVSDSLLQNLQPITQQRVSGAILILVHLRLQSKYYFCSPFPDYTHNGPPFSAND